MIAIAAALWAVVAVQHATPQQHIIVGQPHWHVTQQSK